MTMTAGQQLAPYVMEDTSTQEKEAVPCETMSFDLRGPGEGFFPKGKIPHPENPDIGLCPNEATWEGVCPFGDTSVNVCDECHTRLVLGETAGVLQGPVRRGRFTMIRKDCTFFGTGDPGAHPAYHEWMWFKR